MEKIKCIVLDNDIINCDVVASYLEETTRIELAGKFTKPSKAAQFLMREQVPLVFIDYGNARGGNSSIFLTMNV